MNGKTARKLRQIAKKQDMLKTDVAYDKLKLAHKKRITSLK